MICTLRPDSLAFTVCISKPSRTGTRRPPSLTRSRKPSESRIVDWEQAGRQHCRLGRTNRPGICAYCPAFECEPLCAVSIIITSCRRGANGSCHGRAIVSDLPTSRLRVTRWAVGSLKLPAFLRRHDSCRSPLQKVYSFGSAARGSNSRELVILRIMLRSGIDVPSVASWESAHRRPDRRQPSLETLRGFP